MTKRLNPFSNDTPQQWKTFVTPVHNATEEDKKTVYERTLQKMRDGSQNLQFKETPTIGSDKVPLEGVVPVCPVKGKGKEKAKQKVVNRCSGCGAPASGPAAKCNHCDKVVCLPCTKQCHACVLTFCSLCSIVNYDEPEVRNFCFGCLQS